VIRNVAAALDAFDIDAAAGQLRAIHQNVFALGLTAERYHRRMLDDDPRIRTATVTNVRVQPALQFERFAVAAGTEVDQPRSRCCGTRLLQRQAPSVLD
jgi:hypothetical protein